MCTQIGTYIHVYVDTVCTVGCLFRKKNSSAYNTHYMYFYCVYYKSVYVHVHVDLHIYLYVIHHTSHG